MANSKTFKINSRSYDIGFQAGKNYVLEQIQSCIDRHEDGCLALEAIILTIDGLK